MSMAYVLFILVSRLVSRAPRAAADPVPRYRFDRRQKTWIPASDRVEARPPPEPE